jgi:hypothetical protein
MPVDDVLHDVGREQCEPQDATHVAAVDFLRSGAHSVGLVMVLFPCGAVMAVPVRSEQRAL